MSKILGNIEKGMIPGCYGGDIFNEDGKYYSTVMAACDIDTDHATVAYRRDGILKSGAPLGMGLETDETCGKCYMIPLEEFWDKHCD